MLARVQKARFWRAGFARPQGGIARPKLPKNLAEKFSVKC
jgi:hypothetical protein